MSGEDPCQQTALRSSRSTFYEDWPWLLLAIGVGVFAYSALFFAWVSVAAPEMATFILSEDTKVSGDSVSSETVYAETGDETLDAWIQTYVSARTTTASLCVIGVIGGAAYLFF